MTRTVPIPIKVADGFNVEKWRIYSIHFSTKPGGVASILKPNRSLICVEKITTAIPVVNPVVTGKGMNLINAPIRNNPKAIRKPPANNVQ